MPFLTGEGKRTSNMFDELEGPFTPSVALEITVKARHCLPCWTQQKLLTVTLRSASRRS